jgi:hypothetical protein
MRTTITLEPDVEKLLRDETHRTRRSFKAVVNDAIRTGLASRRVEEPAPVYRVKPASMGLRPGVDTTQLQDLADELEAEAFRSLSPDSSE